MKTIKKVLIIILVIAIIGVSAYYIGVRNGKLAEKPTITSSTIESQIKSIKELSTVQYYYTNMGSFENQNEFYGIKIPLTLKKFIVTYDGVIKAGISLEDVKVSVSDNQITVDLPEGEILSHEIYEDSLMIYDEKNSIFNPIKIEDYTSFTEDQKSTMESKAIERGILDEAIKDAKLAIEEGLNIIPEVREEYTIVFK